LSLIRETHLPAQTLQVRLFMSFYEYS
jgi:hypothetical protein